MLKVPNKGFDMGPWGPCSGPWFPNNGLGSMFFELNSANLNYLGVNSGGIWESDVFGVGPQDGL